MKFELDYEFELLKLEKELKSRTYLPSKSICFVVTKPTQREVFAANFRDRIVHHLIYNFLEPVFEPQFIDQSYACRKNKGSSRSLQDLKKYLGKISKNHTEKAYFMHLDIRGFFMSLQKEILFGLIKKKIKNPEILWLIEVIIFSNPTKNFTAKSPMALFAKIPPHKSLFHIPPNQGLPIGNLTSQFFANVYLNELDQFIKHRLKIKYYLRYVDDFLFLSENPQELEVWKEKTELFLKEELGLGLNHKKEIMAEIGTGIDWLGYIIKPSHTLSRKRIIKTFKQRLYFFNLELEAFPDVADARGQLFLPFLENYPALITVEKMLATVNSYFGQFGYADSFKLRKNLWGTKFQRLNNYIEPKDEKILCFKIKEDFMKKMKRARDGKHHCHTGIS